MIFKSSTRIHVLIAIIGLILIALQFVTRFNFINLSIYIIYLKCIAYVFETYTIEEETLEKRICRNVTKIPLSSITHIRRIYGMAEEDLKDRSATYLISDGSRYIKLNKLAKNNQGQTLIDVLLDDYQVPVRNEKSIWVIKIKLDYDSK